MAKCEHKNIEFHGIQKTLHENKPLYLFSCKTCGSTIAIKKSDIYKLILSIADSSS